MEDKPNTIIKYGIILLVGIILFGALATYTGQIVYSNDIQTQYTGSGTEEIISNGSTTLNIAELSKEKFAFTASSAEKYNNSWLSFDGVNDYVDVSDTELQSSSESNLTISIWAYMPRNKTNTEWENTVNSSKLFWIEDDTPGLQYSRTGGGVHRLRFIVKNQTANSIDALEYNYVYPINEWHNIVGRLEGTNMTIWLDGVLVANNTSSTLNVHQTTPDIRIGKDDNNRYWLGDIDEVRYYNQSLSDVQITEIYNSGRIANASLPSDGLVLWYSFDESQETTIYDKSGNGNHGE